MGNKFSQAMDKLAVLKSEVFGEKIRSTAPEAGFFYQDAKYKRYFEKTIWPSLSKTHVDDYFVCCAFCTNLEKSNCHVHCFRCAKNTYAECSVLLPGTFSFRGLYVDASGEDLIPWIFKTPCTAFEQLGNRNYFRNFVSSDLSITAANYEALEGIFFGISRGKRPCHICASVNMEIYNKCCDSDRYVENLPCPKIIAEMKKEYQVIQNLIRNID